MVLPLEAKGVLIPSGLPNGVPDLAFRSVPVEVDAYAVLAYYWTVHDFIQ